MIFMSQEVSTFFADDDGHDDDGDADDDGFEK